MGKAKKTAAQEISTVHLRLLLLASLLSGVAALVFELLWIRELTLLTGSTQAAISVVLSVFFLGLALGNRLAALFTHRLRRALLIYMGAEAGIALWALLFYPLLWGLGRGYEAVYASLSHGSPLVLILRTLSSAAILLVPTTCMGLTLPILAQVGARELQRAPRWSACVYGLNTLGAMGGTLLAGFYLVEQFGVSRPLIATALLNLGCVALALPAFRALPADREPSGAESAPHDGLTRIGFLLLVAFGVLGFANIAAEVLWTRFYALLYHNDTYIFSSILMVYLFGVGAGSLLGGVLVRHLQRPILALGILQMISAGWTAAMVLFVPRMFHEGFGYGNSYGEYLRNYLICLIAGVLVPTLCMGISFPVIVRAVLVHPRQCGPIVGRALAWNTVGGVFGSAFAGFVVLEHLGLGAGLLFVVGLLFLVGLTLCILPAAQRRRGLLAGALFLLPLLAVLGLWPRSLPRFLVSHHTGPGTKILDTQPSVHGTVSVTEDAGGERYLWVNNVWVARETTHMVFGYVPWILHPGPLKDGLGICCGTGRTFGSLLSAGLPNIDLVEINASVIETSREWFARSNHGVLTDARVNVILDDGRNFVRYSPATYDIITLEPLQMYQKGVVYFYTEDFYREARARMREGGVICQWLPLYAPVREDLRSMIATFIGVFPNSLLWSNGEDAVLLGFNVEGTHPGFQREEILERYRTPGVAEDMSREYVGSEYDLYMGTYLDGPALAQVAGDAPIYTDDRPTLEFTAPRARGSTPGGYRLLMPHTVPLERVYPFLDAELLRRMTRLRDLRIRAMATQDPRLSGEAERATRSFNEWVAANRP